jgi:hypothetical protein
MFELEVPRREGLRIYSIIISRSNEIIILMRNENGKFDANHLF